MKKSPDTPPIFSDISRDTEDIGGPPIESDESLTTISEWLCTPGSRESDFLNLLIANIRQRYNLNHRVPEVTSSTVVGASSVRFVPQGETFISPSIANIRRLMVVRGQLEVGMMTHEGRFRISSVLGRHASVGGGEAGLMEDGKFPKGYVTVKAGGEYTPYIHPYEFRAREVPDLRLVKMAEISDNLANIKPAHSSYLSALMDAYKVKHPDLNIHELSLSQLTEGAHDEPRLLEALAIFERELSLSEYRYEKGVHIAHLPTDDHQIRFNTYNYLPGLIKELDHLKLILGQQGVQLDECLPELEREAQTIFKKNKHLSVSEIARLKVDNIRDIIAGFSVMSVNEKLNTPISLTPDQKRVFSLIGFAETYAQIPILESLIHTDSNGVLVVLQSLYERGLIEERGQLFCPTVKGLSLVDEMLSDVEKLDIKLFLLHYFLDHQSWFFASQLLIELGEDSINGLGEAHLRLEGLMQDLAQAPHPILSKNDQLQALGIILQLLPEDDPKIEELEFKTVMSSYLSRDLKEALHLAEGYMSKYLSHPNSPRLKDQYITLVFIQLEALETMGKWHKILNLFNQYDQLSEIIGSKESDLWHRFSAARAKVMTSSTQDDKHLYSLISSTIDEMEDQLPNQESLEDMHDLTKIKLRSMLQRLYKMKDQYGKPTDKLQANQKIIDHGLQAIKDAKNVDVIYLQVINAYLSMAYRSQKKYKESLLCAEQIAFDRRGESWEKIQCITVLSTVYEFLFAAVNRGDIGQSRDFCGHLADVVEQLLLRKQVPDHLEDLVDQYKNWLSYLAKCLTDVQQLNVYKADIEILIRGLSNDICKESFINANQADTPYEQVLSCGNWLDSQVLLKEVVDRYKAENGKVSEHLSYFEQQVSTELMAEIIIDFDRLFLKNFGQSYRKRHPMASILEGFGFMHRRQVMQWLEDEEELEGKEVGLSLYHIRKGLVAYADIIASDPQLFSNRQRYPTGFPQEYLSRSALAHVQSQVEVYEKEALL